MYVNFVIVHATDTDIYISREHPTLMACTAESACSECSGLRRQAPVPSSRP